MTAQRPHRTHGWVFSSVMRDDDIYIVAVCDRCGDTRTGLASTRTEHRYIDLTGPCPGEPQLGDQPPDDPRKAAR